MASLADLTQWRDDLIRARSRGVRRVRDTDGSEVEYRSDAEMKAAIAAVENLISATYQSQPIKTVRFTTSKGL